MVLFLLLFCVVNWSLIADGEDASKNKFGVSSILCRYKGNMNQSSSSCIPTLSPKDIPCECDVIVYSSLYIDSTSQFCVDTNLLQELTSLNKPVLIAIKRDVSYSGWSDILSSDGNSAETAKLCDFAKANNISGFVVNDLAPLSYTESLDVNVAKFILPYLKQLKCCDDFIIAVTIEPYAPFVKNPCVYNFEKMNTLVNFYDINTYDLNVCDPTLYNGRSPLLQSRHGSCYLLGMQEVTKFLKASKINYSMVYYNVELIPIDTNFYDYVSYNQVCLGQSNASTWCIQTTHDLFEKGKFIGSEKCGLSAKWVELDDVLNACNCSLPFIGFQNALAGYHGKTEIPCARFSG